MAGEYPWDREKALALLKGFVRLETVNPPGNEMKSAEFLAEELRSYGLEPEIWDLGSGHANVTVRLAGDGRSPALVFNGHMDVVPVGQAPWRHSPFGGEIVGGRLYGRGASDMKAGVAAMLVATGALAVKKPRLRGDLLFSAVADEESGGSGARRLLTDGFLKNAGAVVIGEPTDFKVYTAEKGLVWVDIETRGKTAHGAMPHLGRNAIVDMHEVIREIEGIEPLVGSDSHNGKTTINVGTIKGGVSPNVVPDSCTVALDIRLPAGLGPDPIIRQLELAVERAATRRPGLEATIKRRGNRTPVATPSSARIVELSLDLCRELLGLDQKALPTPGYATDASILCRDGKVPFVIMGPGHEEMAHKPDEYVEVEAYLRAIELYCTMAERFLSHS
jgi:succinyl-diaminopimelate desuccinylase